jgi:hypothetical protein
VGRAIEAAVEFLLAYDLADANYPPSEHVSPNWFRFGYPLSYASDILEALDALAAVGRAHDARLANAIQFVLSKQDAQGRWKLEHTLNGKMWTDIERKGQPSKWVTLRALRVLKATGQLA